MIWMKSDATTEARETSVWERAAIGKAENKRMYPREVRSDEASVGYYNDVGIVRELWR